MEYTEIYYAIRIDTGTTETNLNIGLDTGILTLITERYAETTSAINTIDSEVYTTKKYSGFLDKKGIGKTKQSIDIINGGDYSNLNNFSFSVINTASNGETYISEIDALTEAYLIGSKIQYFVCTPIAVGNDEWLPKWTGIIDNIVPSGLGIKFSCIDRFMKDYLMMPKTVVTNEAGEKGNIPVVFGDSKFSKPLTTINTRTILPEFKSQAVLRIKPNITEDRAFKWTPDDGPSAPGVEYATGLKRRYFHEQLPANSTIEIPEWEHGTEYAGRNMSALNNDSQKTWGNQYNNGTTWAVVSHKRSFDEDDDTFYIGKYIQFTENKKVSQEELQDNEIFRIIGLDHWGTSLYGGSETGSEYCAFYIEQAPSILIDRTQFFGDTLNVDGEHGGEIVNDDTLYFNVVTVENKAIISESPIEGILEPTTEEQFIYPSNQMKVYTKGVDSDIITSIPINDSDFTIDKPYISIAGGKYTGNTIDSFIYLKPHAGTWRNMEPDHADSNGMFKTLVNSIDGDSTTFDWVAPGLANTWTEANPLRRCIGYAYPDDNFKYLKTNISLKFDNLFQPDDYDDYYILPNYQQQQSWSTWHQCTRRIYDNPLGPCTCNGASMKDFDAPADTDQNQGNLWAHFYDIEIRGTVDTFEGLRYSQNYNDSDNYAINPYSIRKELARTNPPFGPGYPEFVFINSAPLMMSMIPLNIIPFTGTQSYNEGFMNIFPRQMRFDNYDTDYNNNDRFLVDGFYYDTINELKFDKELLSLNSDDESYGIICSMTPQESVEWSTTNTIPTWDVFKLYNIGMLLRKEIDVTQDIYLKVKGEKLGSGEKIVVVGTDSASYDGEYLITSDPLIYEHPTTLNTIAVTNILSDIYTWTIIDTTVGAPEYEKAQSGGDVPVGAWSPIVPNLLSPNVQWNNGQTDTVYNTFRHIVDSYSTVTDVNYHNLTEQRQSWNVGRQITTRKNSFDYIRELCKQTFIAGWVDGAGTLNFSAFRDGLAEDDTLVLHDSSIIIDGSIKNFKRTPISKVYNQINVQYDWNPITQKFNFNYAINKVDEPSFPLSTDSWEDYVQGIENYATAKGIWDRAHESYLETRIANLTPSDRSDLKWANDLGNFNDSTNYDKTDEYAYKYFIMTTDWNTRQKNQVTYKLPLNDDTKVLNLMQRVRFNDPLYTGITNFTGWITTLELDALKDIITITLTMELNKSRWVGGDCSEIVERSTNIDVIIEDTINTDEIEEGC